MEERLDPIKETSTSLPKPLSIQLKGFVSSIFSRKNEMIPCEKSTHIYEPTPTFFPSSMQFKFEIACKDPFKDNEKFLALKANANKIVEDIQESLRDMIISVQKIEEMDAKTLLQ